MAQVGHYEILRDMFPNKLFLDAADIAKCLNVSKGHVYNLASVKVSAKTGKSLPFKLDVHTDKIQVSIIAMSRYLDSTIDDGIQTEVEEKEDVVSVPDLIQSKKRGRPKNSKTNILAFQSELKLEILKEEVSWMFNDMQEKIDELEYPSSEEIACSVKFKDAKDDFSQMAKFGKSYISQSFMGLTLGMKKKIKVKKEF